MNNNDYDVIIIGTGAGGGTLAYALAGWGKKILLLERGDYLPRERENWMPEKVFGEARYKTSEQWLNRCDVPFSPGMHYWVGGNTKMYGAALVRLRNEDFGEFRLRDGVSPEWPIPYEDFEPFYSQAEQIYRVHGAAGEDPTDPPRSTPFPYPPIPHEPQIEQLAAALRMQGLHPFHLPMGVDRAQPNPSAGRCVLWKTCDGFPCLLGAKSDAEMNAVRPALSDPNIQLFRNAKVERLVTTSDGKEIEWVEASVNNETLRFKGHLVVVSCGAVNSAALLLRSTDDKHPHGLANSSGLVGCNYMAHLNGTVMAVNPFRRQKTVFQKTLSLNDYYLKGPRGDYPLGNLQLIGKLQKGMLLMDKPWVPGCILDWLAIHSVDWWVLSEDLPLRENRVELTRSGQIKLNVRWTNRGAHRELIALLRGALRKAGYLVSFKKVWDVESCSHQVGTLRFGHDPRASVLDVFCRTHDVTNLFVVDGSFFPSSGAVNPALTIMAQALRVGKWIRENWSAL